MKGIEFMKKLKDEITKAVVGKEDVLELLAVALLSRGHVLLEGIPGVAKTTIAKAFAKAIGLKFSRVQITLDLMPADIVGGAYYDQRTSEFKIKKGPIFANVVLADEINRATPKTQSALLEAMQERQVTIEGTTFELPDPFLLIATMNPIEAEGVYKLPEAQLDRFMMKIQMGYPYKDEEILLLKRKESGDFGEIQRIVDREDVLKLIDEAGRIKVSDEVISYIYEISFRTRTDDRVLLGASPRALEHLLFASKSLAFLRGRDYVVPDDVKELATSILAHRILIKAEYEIDGLKAEDLIKEILEEVEVSK
ncbi:MoxR-like ATPase [Archaeoglobus sulfaticallidus PM70-1]|uniref:MoxR-like ATPase n=1 Tax=Archaeoglobus sulfaticallidus PM70-1 TaxID=387631 RepID=N0BFL3_9EURY|nr:MoxR-like ATPase [Archaeoglobus sulfaticallidus PM70-1]